MYATRTTRSKCKPMYLVLYWNKINPLKKSMINNRIIEARYEQLFTKCTFL